MDLTALGHDLEPNSLLWAPPTQLISTKKHLPPWIAKDWLWACCLIERTRFDARRTNEKINKQNKILPGHIFNKEKIEKRKFNNDISQKIWSSHSVTIGLSCKLRFECYFSFQFALHVFDCDSSGIYCYILTVYGIFYLNFPCRRRVIISLVYLW